jgi:hypothetical protein
VDVLVKGVLVLLENLDAEEEAMKMNESTKTRTFKCYMCGKQFGSIQDLIKHDLKLDYRQKK